MKKYFSPHRWIVHGVLLENREFRKSKKSYTRKVVVWQCKNCGCFIFSWNGVPPTNRNYWENSFHGYLREYDSIATEVSWDCEEVQVRRIIED